MDDTSFRDNPALQRFELLAGDDVAAFADYRLEPARIRFIHTEVSSRHEGKGMGSKLARAALDAVRQRGLSVVPECEFIAGYIRKRPAEHDLVSPADRDTYKI